MLTPEQRDRIAASISLKLRRKRNRDRVIRAMEIVGAILFGIGVGTKL